MPAVLMLVKGARAKARTIAMEGSIYRCLAMLADCAVLTPMH